MSDTTNIYQQYNSTFEIDAEILEAIRQGGGGGGGSIQVVQTEGQSTTAVMSQKAVTDALSSAGGGKEILVITEGTSEDNTLAYTKINQEITDNGYEGVANKYDIYIYRPAKGFLFTPLLITKKNDVLYFPTVSPDGNATNYDVVYIWYYGLLSNGQCSQMTQRKFVLEAPVDDKQYARKNAQWVEVEGGAGGDSHYKLVDTVEEAAAEAEGTLSYVKSDDATVVGYDYTVNAVLHSWDGFVDIIGVNQGVEHTELNALFKFRVEYNGNSIRYNNEDNWYINQVYNGEMTPPFIGANRTVGDNIVSLDVISAIGEIEPTENYTNNTYKIHWNGNPIEIFYTLGDGSAVTTWTVTEETVEDFVDGQLYLKKKNNLFRIDTFSPYTTTDLSSITEPSNMQIVTVVDDSNNPMCTFEYDSVNSVWLPQMLYYDYLPESGGILTTICNTMMANKSNIRLHTKLNIKFNTSETETVNLEMFVKDFWEGTNITFTALFNVYTEGANVMKFIDANFYLNGEVWYKRPENPMIQD